MEPFTNSFTGSNFGIK